MNLRRRIALGAVLALAGAAVGCAIFMGETLKSLDLEAASVNAIKVEGKTVALTGLVAAVKSAGAGKSTLITVNVAADAPRATGKLIRDVLTQNNFPKVILAQHHTPTVSVAPVQAAPVTPPKSSSGTGKR